MSCLSPTSSRITRLSLVWLCLLLSLAVFPSLGRAQEGSAPEGEVEDTGFRPLTGPGTEEISRIWENCINYFDSGKYPDLLVELDKLRQARADAGIRNLRSLSSALVFMAQKVLEKNAGDLGVALDISRFSQVLSPDIPDFYFLRSNLLWKYDKAAVGQYAGEYFRGLKASTRFLPSIHGLILGSVTIFWAVGLLAMALFSIVLLVRHLSLFAHDAGHLLPRALSQTQLNIIALIVLMIPFLADMGLVPLFALWWVALWTYQTRQERVVTVILTLFVYLWPIMNTLFANSITFSEAPAHSAFVCNYEDCDQKTQARLTATIEAEKDDGTALFALASANLRGSRTSTDLLDQAQMMFKQGIKGISSDQRKDFYVGLGNVYFLQGMRRCNRARGRVDAGLDEFQDARKNYDAALGVDPNNRAALYNRGRVLKMLGNSSEGAHSIDKLTAMDPEMADELQRRSVIPKDNECSESFNGNRELAMPVQKPQLLRDPGTESEKYASLSHLPAAHALLIGPLECWMLSILATLVLVLVIALSLVRKLVVPSTRCTKCGEISCIRCRPELSGTGLCNQCVYYKIRSSYVDPKETWLREKRIENRRDTRRRVEALLTFILPGAGHMLRGRPVRGLIFVLCLGWSLSAVFLFPTLVSLAAWPTLSLSQTSVVGTAFWSVAAFVAYFLSLLDIYSWR